MRQMWKVTADRANAFIQQFLTGKVVAIGWSAAGDVTQLTSKADLLMRFREVYPDDSPRQIDVAASQVWRFLKDIKDGDRVVTYDPVSRLYHVGTILGPATYQAENIERLPTVRPVDWISTRGRDDLSQQTKNSLGAIMTLFRVSDAGAAELERQTAGVGAPPTALPSQELVEEADIYSSIVEQALERVKDKIQRLEWDEMQDLVAALLRALGYRTIVSPMGPDRGKDIVASRDGFGFERPRIVVEVKHRKDAMGAQEIRSFVGGRHADDRGLYVSTGGFTKDAHYEAERASTVTHLMTLDGLARALLDQYETLDERGKRLLPLTKLYWPAW